LHGPRRGLGLTEDGRGGQSESGCGEAREAEEQLERVHRSMPWALPPALTPAGP